MISLAAAATFTWLGMVVAISFMEAPLKFRAPGVTIPLGLGIGRLVFRALNAAETVLAVVVVAGLLLGDPSTTGVAALAVAIVTLVAQFALVRPRLTRRSDRILAGEEAPRSHAHHAYVALEVVKVVALVTGGAAVLAAS
ncbi:hypothetical protein Acsp03_64990 [Actinomadura sp. NBRC 104412]|uniref:hypothetical protein n=1 Tax=Actinomadura sp. NBRC 104412 TaxID=3032203 RepID=UPI0024A20515|nr:hypothetical protein [Actinomadura sp. NBRC 104412]GLZ09033.1 hypothetical protein Acsp03_64990 [Actinomadura sp. NBRC 104412]